MQVLAWLNVLECAMVPWMCIMVVRSVHKRFVCNSVQPACHGCELFHAGFLGQVNLHPDLAPAGTSPSCMLHTSVNCCTSIEPVSRRKHTGTERHARCQLGWSSWRQQFNSMARHARTSVRAARWRCDCMHTSVKTCLLQSFIRGG